jgi:DNA adenine methylase
LNMPKMDHADPPVRTKANGKLSSPLKSHGGKHDLADWIISLMPPRVRNPNAPASGDLGWCHYVEPYFGAGHVLFALDPIGISEVANDLNGEIMNFFDVVKSRLHFPELLRLAELTPVSQLEFERAGRDASTLSPPERALAFFVRSRQSRQALGKHFCNPVRSRTRRGMQEHVSACLTAIEGLPAAHARLQRVLILNKPALEVIRQQDGPRTLFYLDPPYPHGTRTARDAYTQFEMTTADHQELLDLIRQCKGKVMISSYPSRMYDLALVDWNRHDLDIANHAASGKKKDRETEVLWCNFP